MTNITEAAPGTMLTSKSPEYISIQKELALRAAMGLEGDALDERVSEWIINNSKLFSNVFSEIAAIPDARERFNAPEGQQNFLDEVEAILERQRK